MIYVDDLFKYDKIILWGLNVNNINRYINIMGKDKIRIVDSDEKKTGQSYQEIIIEDKKIVQELPNNCAIIILPLAYENEIYDVIRRLGFNGDVYADDMIDFSKKSNENNINEVGGEFYTIEKHTQILLRLLKEFNIKNIVVSPGTCNMNFVISVQSDSFFKVWSCIDERSAAYIACGIAQSTCSPVVISCTGATASRNYMSALTEAYYSKLPILAITSSRDSYMIGNGIDQITNRRDLPKDIANYSVECSEIHNIEERKYCELNLNRALNTLYMNGGGPVHINLITRFKKDFSVKALPRCNVIKNVLLKNEDFPPINGNFVLYIKPIKFKVINSCKKKIEKFCEKYGVVIIGDNLSNYSGKYFVDISLISQQQNNYKMPIIDTMIIVGEVNEPLNIQCNSTWMISEDGKIIDTYLNLKYHFDMSLEDFLDYYNRQDYTNKSDLYNKLNDIRMNIISEIPELPFSNIWVASYASSLIPKNSICYFAVFSTLKSWGCYPVDKTIKCFSTVGGYGIDGCISATIGASLINKDVLCFAFVGDLSFHYDMNSLGNRHISNNLRIMVFNNNGGNSLMYRMGEPKGVQLSENIGAADHYNNGIYIKPYVESLGFKYLRAESKRQFKDRCGIFMDKNVNQSIVFEVVYDKNNDFESKEKLSNLI